MNVIEHRYELKIVWPLNKRLPKMGDRFTESILGGEGVHYFRGTAHVENLQWRADDDGRRTWARVDLCIYSKRFYDHNMALVRIEFE